MKIRTLVASAVVLVGAAWVVTEVIPAMDENRRLRTGRKELDRARSKMNQIKNQIMPESERAALQAAYELQGRLGYIQEHYGVDSETIDGIVGTELNRMICSLKKNNP